MNAKTMIRKLLNCPELNRAKLSASTRVTIETARQQFGITKQMVVVLRDGGKDDLFALFPEDPANALGILCTCYCEVGGHIAAGYFLCLGNSKPAKGKRAKQILDALATAGYDNLRVIKQATPAMHKRRMKL